jgi:hypothetical protein
MPGSTAIRLFLSELGVGGHSTIGEMSSNKKRKFDMPNHLKITTYQKIVLKELESFNDWERQPADKEIEINSIKKMNTDLAVKLGKEKY